MSQTSNIFYFNSDEEFFVEAIVKVVSKFGHLHPIPQSPEDQLFEVKWLGWPSKFNTYEPRDEMERKCHALIDTLFNNPPQNPDFFICMGQ